MRQDLVKQMRKHMVRRTSQGVLVGERKRICGNCLKVKMGEFFFPHFTLLNSQAWRIGRISSGPFLLIPIVSDQIFYIFHINVSGIGTYTGNDRAAVPWGHITSNPSHWIQDWDPQYHLKDPSKMVASEVTRIYHHLLSLQSDPQWVFTFSKALEKDKTHWMRMSRGSKGKEPIKKLEWMDVGEEEDEQDNMAVEVELTSGDQDFPPVSDYNVAGPSGSGINTVPPSPFEGQEQGQKKRMRSPSEDMVTHAKRPKVQPATPCTRTTR
jgi:hypothetical protein